MSSFGRKGLTSKPVKPRAYNDDAHPQNVPLRIVVPRRVVQQEAEAYEVAQSVVNFVNHALHKCAFERDELPQEAMWAFHVDYYIAQVNNGGHGQFAHNSGWHDFIINDIKQGLAAIGTRAAIETFDSFVTFSKMEPARFDGSVERSGFGKEDDFVKKLDQTFYAGLGDEIRLALYHWLVSNPALEIVEDADYQQCMTNLANRNPQCEERLQQRERDRLAARNADPMHQLLNYICRTTPGDVRFERCISAHPQGDQGGVVYRVVTSAGVGQIFVLPEGFGGLLIASEEQPRSKIPLAMIDGYLVREGIPPISPQIAAGAV